MLRTSWQYSAGGAVKYLSQADYYATSPGQLLGKGFGHLHTSGMSARDVFECLAHNLDPRTGQKLRPLAREGERVGMDFTFNSTKSVGIARELAGADNKGDPRVELAHEEAVRYAMSLIERDVATRVRGGRDGDRVTGNLLAYMVTHRDTRISPEDHRPDMSLHSHVFVLNTTYDPVEQRWKACQLAQIKHDAPFYEAAYHARLASNLRDLGYGIRRKDKAFEIAGISDDLVRKFSRRTQQIEAVAKKLGIEKPESKAKLGATTRMGKAKELADDLNGYYVSRLTGEEKQQLGDLKGKPSYLSSDDKAVRYAIEHLFERKSVVEEKRLYETALRFGIGSVTVEGVQAEAQKQGVLLRGDEATTRDVLAEEARVIAFARDGRGTCRGMGVGYGPGLIPAGSVLPCLVTARRQGNDPSAHMAICSPIALSTPLVSLVSIHDAAADTDPATLPGFGQGKGRPDESRRPPDLVGKLDTLQHLPKGLTLGERSKQGDTATLSPERQAVSPDHIADISKLVDLSPDQLRIARHVWDSPDRVILIRGAAGTGKTHTMKATIGGIDRPVVVLAPSAEASRGVLRKEGFDDADTVARFLQDEKFQQRAKDGVIWVDEAGLLGIRQTRQLFDLADRLDARVVLQGDNKQHGSVERGATLRVLQQFAGLPVAELTDIRRQRGDYKKAVADLAKGDILAGYDKLAGLGWVKEAGDNKPLVDDYMAALASGKSALVVAPTHVEGNEITAEIRDRLKDGGKLDREEVVVEQLVPLGWTDAEKGDVERYEGTEVLKYHRNSGTRRAGDRVRVADWKPGQRLGDPRHFAVYARSSVNLAVGDLIRITANGRTRDGQHKLNNGAQYTVAGFTKEGDIALSNGWTVAKSYGHLAHGYVSTSHASQGKTVDRVLIAMGHESVPAMSAEQFYVSVSRGRERATVYSDLKPEHLREAIQKKDARKSATELMGPVKALRPNKLKSFMVTMRKRFDRLKDRAADVIKAAIRTHERDRHELSR